MKFVLILLGSLMGFFTALDLLYLNKKEKKSFVRYIYYVLATVIPSILVSYFYNTEKNIESIPFLYIAFVASIFIFFLLVYLLYYLPISFSIKGYRNNHTLSFLKLLLNGYFSFDKELKAIKDSIQKQKRNQNINLLDELDSEIRTFISNIYKLLDEETELQGYIVYVLMTFIAKFLGESNARLTLRKLSDDKKKMESIFSTCSNKSPGDIPVKRTNMIKYSLEKNKPIIYSENKSKHYKTKKNSIESEYDDYVTSCLLKHKNGLPLFSISLDVKGKSNCIRMHKFVKSSIFSLMCEAIIIKIQKTYEKAC